MYIRISRQNKSLNLRYIPHEIFSMNRGMGVPVNRSGAALVLGVSEGRSLRG